MKLDNFYKNSIVLTGSNLITGFIGFLFSIILSRKLGAEGLGLFSLVMPVYVLLLCLTADGLITAISRISAIYWDKRDFKNLNRTLTTVFIFISFWSLSVAVVSFIGSSNIFSIIIKDSRVSDALKIICPALVFVPMSAILKGYFYGMGKFKITASIDIVEKLFRVFVLLGTIAVFSLHDVKSTVSAAYFALTIGESTSFILLYIFYRAYSSRNKESSFKSKSRPQLLSDVLAISIPIGLNGFLSSILSTASTLLLPRRLVTAGIAYNSSLALIGKFLGMALSITYLPFIIISSLQTALIPDLSLSISNKDFWSTGKRILQVMRISCLVGISTLIISLTVPDSLGLMFYNRTDLGGMIKFASLSAFFSYIATPTFAILNGLGKQTINLRNSLIVSVQDLILIYIFTGISSINIYGYGIALAVTSITALIMNLYEIRKICDVRVKLSEIFAYGVIGIFTFSILKFVNRGIPVSFPLLKIGVTSILGFAMVFMLFRLFQKLSIRG